MKHPGKRLPIIPIILLVLAILYLFPLYLLIANSFKSYDAFMRSPYDFPVHPELSSLAEAFRRSHFPQAAGNSLLTTLLVVALLAVFSSMAAYAFTRRRGRWLNASYLYVIAGVLIPFQVYMIPLVREFQLLGLGRSLLALVLALAAQNTPLSVFLYAGYLKTVPSELEEAAVMDGCGPYRLFWQIIFPVLTPCTSTVVILMGVNVWNAFVQPMTIVGNSRWRLLFVQVYNLVGSNFYQRWNLAFAACFLASLPMLLIYILMQNRIIGGLTSGAVKG